MSGGGDKNVLDNITSNNIYIITSSSEKKEKSEEEVQNIKEETRGLKEALLKIDKTLLFTEAFYPKASAFLAREGLPENYLAWLYDYCEKQKPRNVMNYYYKLFFSEQMTELFRQIPKTPDAPEIKKEDCPVCGEEVLNGWKTCPRCHFDMAERDEEKIKTEREKHKRKTAEINAVGETEANIMARIKKIVEINRRYESSA